MIFRDRSLTGNSPIRPNRVRLCMHGFHRIKVSCLVSLLQKLLVPMAFLYVMRVLFARPWGLNVSEPD